MYIKVYFANKPVFLCDNIDKELNEILHHPDAVFVDEISTKAINAFLHEIKKDTFHAGVIWGKNLPELVKSFFKHFTYIDAAGGIVENSKKEILLIQRLGKWDLPKGKIDEHETPEDCAIREIEEETGASNLIITDTLGETYHTYDAYGKHFLKKTYWYLLKCKGKQNLIPQTTEDITALEWCNAKELQKIKKNTYPAILDVLSRYAEKIKI